MKTRIIWGLVVIAIVLPIVIFANDIIFACFATIGGLVAVSELINAKKNVPILHRVVMYLALIFTGAYSYYFGLIDSVYYVLLFVVFMVISVLYQNLKKLNFIDAAVILVMTLYLMYGFNALIDVKVNYGLKLFFYPIIVAMLADTFGYLGGMLFGKHKLIPAISPNKTIEGAISATLVALIGSYFYLKYSLDYELSYILIISIIVVILSQMGDLVASFIKRTFEIKDYSKLIPGHGGVLDRFDSILFNFIVLSVILYFI